MDEAASVADTHGRLDDAVDRLGVLLIDPAIHDKREISTLSQFCGG